MQLENTGKFSGIVDKLKLYNDMADDIEYSAIYGRHYSKTIVTAAKLNRLMRFIYSMLPGKEGKGITVAEVREMARQIIETGIYVIPQFKNMQFPISKQNYMELKEKLGIYARRRTLMQDVAKAEKPNKKDKKGEKVE